MNSTLQIRTADEARTIGALDTFATVEVRGSELRLGMVVCDSLDTAYIVLNERLRRGPRDAGKTFAGYCPETGRYIDHAFHDNTTYRVATARMQEA